jgi:hypothetical protein
VNLKNVTNVINSIENSFAENKKQGKIKLDICKQCESFDNTLKVCKVCHCFMPAKTRLPGQVCPVGKW